MPDMIQPVGAMIKVPDPMQGINTMSGILGIQQQRQALTQGEQQIQSNQMTNTGASMSLGERQRVQQILSSGVDDQGNSIKDADGTPDPDKAMKWMPRVAPTTYPTYLKGIQETEANKLGLKSTTADLGQKYRDQIGGMLQSGVNDPSFNSQKAEALLVPYGAQNPEAAPAISHALSLLKHLDSVNSGDPKADLAKKNDMLVHTIQAFKPSQANQSVTVDTGPTIQPASQQPLTGAITPTGTPIAKGISPQVITSPTTGGLYRTTAQGGATPITAPGGASAPFQNPGYQGQQSDVAANQTEVRGVRSAGDQAPLAANINQQILQLSKNAKTGPGTDTWQHVVGAVGAPFGLSPTASYQEVGKFLEKNAIANMQSMGGPPSDSRLDAAAKANGSTAFSPEALQKVTKFNDATTTALAQYRQGIDHSIGMGQNVDYTKLPAFKAAWAKNFDVDVFRVENALRDKDSAELAAIKHELGPERLKALAQKRQNLTALAQGQLPQ